MITTHNQQPIPEPLPQLAHSIASLHELYKRGQATCESVVEACLARIEALDPWLKAWVLVDRPGALAHARRLDADRRRGVAMGVLHGVPIGIKDIIDVAHLPTACGSRLWKDQIAESDAEIVARLRAAGAIILGKTVTTPYAWIDPPPTHNPWHPEHTPGGSSSGSAVAVAAGMCLAAIGSQTGGSIIRPATFCGACGFKPTFDAVSRSGVFPLAPDLDHVGPIARNIDDLARLYLVIADHHRGHERAAATPSTPRLGRLRGLFDDRLAPLASIAHEHTLAQIAAAGAAIAEFDSPYITHPAILDWHRQLMAREAALVHAERRLALPSDYPPRITELILEGAAIADTQLDSIRSRRGDITQRLLEALDDAELDALVVPATTGPAPDLSTTGDPAFNSPFSFLGFPAVSFPTALVDHLPVGVQLVGRPGHDVNLLHLAAELQEEFQGEITLSDHAIIQSYERVPRENHHASA